MKTVLVLAGLVALVLGGTVPSQQNNVQTKTVDADFVARQKQILSLVQNIRQVNPNADYYKIGTEYNIQANANNYNNNEVVHEFLRLYNNGFLHQYDLFSIFDEEAREEVIALLSLLYNAKDFDTFYKTAAFARVNINSGQFLYAYYIAVLSRQDTNGFILPAAYEIVPQVYGNSEAIYRVYAVKLQNGLMNPEVAAQYGIVKENNQYVIYANYSDFLSYSNGEQRLAYFTEDIGINLFYYYVNLYFPFWLNGDKLQELKQRRGEGFYYINQQLLARYYLERLANGLGEIPEFSWYSSLKTGYTPLLWYNLPFIQRNNNYNLQNEENMDDIQFLDNYEKTFLQYLQNGHFKAYNQEIDLHNSKSMNFVGNYWQSNADLYEKSGPRSYQRSYEIIARRVLSGAPEPNDNYGVMPSALEFYQTSARDPAFYQLYNRILNYINQYKQYLKPYTQDDLHYVGVKINSVNVEPLVTYFEYFDYDVSNSLLYTTEELNNVSYIYKIRQPRLNHKPFTVTVDVKSDVAADAVVKIMLGPKYDSNGYPISLEDNSQNFFELDWSVQKLTQGENKIQRSSNDFFYSTEDPVTISEIYSLLNQGKVPTQFSEEFFKFPNRMMLPKGAKHGLPYQIFVIVYPYQPVSTELAPHQLAIPDNKPFIYPFDRPVNEDNFWQPNMYIQQVEVYHTGEDYTYMYNVPGYVAQQNEVPKH